MNKVYVLSPEEFSIRVKSHALQVRQMGAIRHGFKEPTDAKTLSTIAKFKELDESLPSILGTSMPDVVTGYFNLFRSAGERLENATAAVSSTPAEHAVKFGEVAVCMFIIKELELMGIS